MQKKKDIPIFRSEGLTASLGHTAPREKNTLVFLVYLKQDRIIYTQTLLDAVLIRTFKENRLLNELSTPILDPRTVKGH